MPAISPITLTVNSVAEVYNPAMSTGSNAEFIDASPAAVYDARLLKMSVRPASAGNSGRVTTHQGIRPIPLAEGGACCTDITKPEGNTFSVNTMVRKTSSKAQADELVDMIRSYVNSTTFKDLVVSSSFY